MKMRLLHTPFFIFALGTIIGAILFLIIYGTSILSFTNTDWLMESKRLEGLSDLAQHYLGWVAYRNSPVSFPLGLTEGLYSSPVSVTYTDSIPLFAIVFKLLSPILPEQFQYFGLFGILSYELTGGFGALVLWKLKVSVSYSIIGSIFFVFSPVLTKRMFYHTALAAPFLILAAFCLCLVASQMKRRKWIGLWSLLTAVAVLINPYYVPMVLGILLCELFYELLRKTSIGTLLLAFFFPVISFLIAGYVSGMFYGSVSASANGLEDLSFNLLQLINPDNELLRIEHRNYLWTTQNYSRFLPVLPLSSSWQEEGFSYLGFGILIILMLVLVSSIIYLFFRSYELLKLHHAPNKNPSAPASKQKKRIFINAPLSASILLGLLVFTFLALSPTATVGSYMLYHIDYPTWIYNLLSIFRSTGRFIWPVYYGFMILGLTGMYRIISRSMTQTSKLFHNNNNNMQHGKVKISLFLPEFFLALCLFLQLVDLSPSLQYKHEVYAQDAAFVSHQSQLSSAAWDELGGACTNLIFYPPTHYGLYCDPEVSCTFVEYALQHGISCNISYLSRNLSKEADIATYEHFAKRESGEPFPENLYLFFDISEIPSSLESGLNYYEIDGYIVGTELDLSDYSDVRMLCPE